MGRVIFGFACGVLSSVIPRYTEEVIPQDYASIFGAIFPVSQTFGILLSQLLGEGLPLEDDLDGLRNSQYWRFIMGFPLILLVISALMVLLIVRYDSPKFLIFNDRRREAELMLRKIYKLDHSMDNLISYIEKSSLRETSFISMRDSVISPLYRRSTWITQALIVFHELTGINAINLYSNQMFQQMAGDKATLTPRQGTYLLGIANMLGVIGAVYLVKRVSRRAMLVPGHVGMGVCHVLVGLFAVYKVNVGVVTMMVCFIMCYQFGNGPVIWLYASEVVVDTALGISICTLWSVVLLLSLTTNFLM